MLSFRKKTNEPIPRKLTDRRKDRRTDPILQDPSGRSRGSNNDYWIFLNFIFLYRCVSFGAIDCNISHKLSRPSQFLEKFMEFWNGSLCRNKSGTFPQLNVTAYWKSSNTEPCAKKLSQILANNTDNGGRGIGLRIYVRYYLKNK